jgi:hypothetical protein
LLNSKAGILLNWAVFEVLDHCGEGSSGFLFTEHLILWCDEISSIEKPETSTYRGKNFFGKFFSLRLNRKFELWKKHNMEKMGVFYGNMNSLRVMENSSYRRSSCGSSTVLMIKITIHTNKVLAKKIVEFLFKIYKK